MDKPYLSLTQDQLAPSCQLILSTDLRMQTPLCFQTKTRGVFAQGYMNI